MATATATEAADQAQPEVRSRKRLITIFIGLILGILMAALDQTIVATALPTIAADLNGLQSISWIITTYLLAQTISMPLYGKFGDIIGRKAAFQVAIVIFLIGSIAAGAAQSMGMLIAVRAIQGVGAGGLMTGAQTIMADIVSARERGKYMSIMGPMIGVATVLGPLLGGYLTQYVSWRWIFYINIPIGIAALIVVGIVLKLPKPQTKPRIDYLGAILMAAGVTCLVLLLNWGGSRFDWLSPTIIALGVAVIVLVPLWLFVERKAKEPILPPHLFRDGVFRINAPLAFMIGVAMFGAISYLPTYLQLSLDASATKSGLLMLPLMGGLMFAAVITGQVISRSGHYKPFPIIGAGVASVGMYLLSLMDATTSRGESSLYMVVLGLGIGFIMPTLVLTVQNSVATRDIGSATANINFFRQIGASFGVAVIGSLFTTRLADEMAQNLPAGALSGSAEAAAAMTPEKLDKLPPAIQHGIVVSYADALTPLYAYFVPLLVLTFILAWFLPEKKLATSLGKSSASDDTDEDSAQQPGDEQAGDEQAAEVTASSGGTAVATAAPPATANGSGHNGSRANGAAANGTAPNGTAIPTAPTAVSNGSAKPAAPTRAADTPADIDTLTVLTGFLGGRPMGDAGHDKDPHGRPVITGVVHDAANTPAPAVLTLVDQNGRQVDRGHTSRDGRYQLRCPDPGVYLVVCTPRNGKADHPSTHMLATDGREVAQDFVLD